MIQGDNVDRSFLRFKEEVMRQFQFLEALGFQCTAAESTIVSYESSTMVINIFHGRQSYEIGLEIALISKLDKFYSIFEILQLVDARRFRDYRNYMTHSEEGIVDGVRRLAELFRECLDSGILADAEIFSKLEEVCGGLTRDYWLKAELAHAREIASDAWAKGDFQRFVNTFSSLQEHLSGSELKKFEYAKREIRR